MAWVLFSQSNPVRQREGSHSSESRSPPVACRTGRRALVAKRQQADASKEGSLAEQATRESRGMAVAQGGDAKSQQGPDGNHSLAGELLSDSESESPSP